MSHLHSRCHCTHSIISINSNILKTIRCKWDDRISVECVAKNATKLQLVLYRTSQNKEFIVTASNSYWIIATNEFINIKEIHIMSSSANR